MSTPTLYLHRSHELERLAALLAGLLAHDAGGDPFEPRTVVVGSRGMERWLRAQLAQAHGICANVRFIFPARALDLLLEPVVGDVPDPDPWAPQALAFTVLGELPGLLDDPALEPVRTWLGDATGPVDRRTWGLARELADVLDRYHLARPELIRRFLSGEPLDDPTEAWQGALWRACRRAIGVPSPTERALAAERTLAEGAQAGLSSLYLFGISALPPLWLALLDAAARSSAIHLMIFAPSEQYWADFLTLPEARRLSRRGPQALAEAQATLARQHPLLTSLGRLSRDMQALIAEHLPNAAEPAAGPLSAGPVRGTALGRLQQDLRALALPAPPHPLAAEDRSLQVHVAAGPARQAQVLRDVLLRLLDADETLEPRDIVVLTPDIDTFGPLLRAALETGGEHPGDPAWIEAGGPRLPCAVSDARLGEDNRAAAALNGLLTLASGRLDAPGLLALAALPPVAARFDLSPDELDLLAGWFDRAGFRWALDAADRARHDQPAETQNTLVFALRRLALGALAPDEGLLLDAGTDPAVAPHDDLEGANVLTLGKLLALAELVERATRELAAARPIPAHTATLRALLDDLAAPTPETRPWFEAIHEALDGLERSAAAYAGPVALSAVRHLLATHFDEVRHVDRPITGAITVSALTPMRSVPFRVVCLVGLDDGAFPRDRARPSWDLVKSRPQVGDREPRDEDRHLLLEAIFAARDHLIVASTGIDPQRGAAIPLPLPVEELLDVLDRSFAPVDGGSARDRIVRRHPLQPTTAAAFVGQESSFDARSARLLATLGRPRSPWVAMPAGTRLPDRSETVIDLEDLARTLAEPQRALCRRLRIRPPEELDEPADREPAEVAGLDRWIVRDRALRELDAGLVHDPRSFARAMRARGELPLGAAGEVEAGHTLEVVRSLHGAITSVRDPAAAVSVDLPLPSGRALVGTVPAVGPHGPVLGSPSKVWRARSILPAWVRLLALAAQGRASQAWIVGWDTRQGVQGLRLDAPEDPVAHLDALVALYDRATSEPIPLLPGASFELAKELARRAGDDPDPDLHGLAHDCIGKAHGAWLNAFGYGDGVPTGDATDDAVKLIFGETAPFVTPDGIDPDFVALSWALWRGPLAAITTVDLPLGEAP